ncbi:MAG: GGDEF domain-containing protein, partial [bacterium]
MKRNFSETPESFKPLETKYRWAVFIGSILLFTIFACEDYWDGPEIHLTVLYLIPVYLGTWFVGFWAGAFFSFLSGLTFLIDPMAAPKLFPDIGPVLFNLVSIIVVYSAFSFALDLLKNKYAEAQDRLKRDSLTGLLNGSAFFEELEAERLRAVRYGHPLTLCFIDLDHFKQVNDTLGHIAGSELLKMTAEILRKSVRASDQVARMGGDEFVILFPETGPDAVKALTAKIKKTLCEGFQARGCGTTPSMG